MIPLEDDHQLKFGFTVPIQDNYEVVRPVVLFAETVSERSRQTGNGPRQRVNRKIQTIT
jgi:hypothetical protein